MSSSSAPGRPGLRRRVDSRSSRAQPAASSAIGVVEKGAAVGAHIVSGAVFEPRALDELFPDWRERGAPVETPVTAERVEWLTSANGRVRVPAFLVPRALRNQRQFHHQLGRSLPVAREPSRGARRQRAAGLRRGRRALRRRARRRRRDRRLRRRARRLAQSRTYQPGYELRAKYTVFAEGCRGHLGRRLEARFGLRASADPQHYGLGFKEIWQIDAAKHRPGEIVHTLGWPLDARDRRRRVRLSRRRRARVRRVSS